LVRLSGDVGAHCAREIVEACEQDYDDQEAEYDG
jgi:hypothetical protein